MTTSNPLTNEDLNAIERGIEANDLTHGQVHQLIAEVPRQRSVLGEIDAATRRVESGIDRVAEQNAQLLTALEHMDAILAAYDQPGVGQLSRAVKAARAWRKSKTSQEASGATQST